MLRQPLIVMTSIVTASEQFQRMRFTIPKRKPILMAHRTRYYRLVRPLTRSGERQCATQ